MFLVGDSHVRSYIRSTHISYAIFLGSGKDINFVSWYGFFNIVFSLFSITGFRKVQYVMIIGEPDARYATFGVWNTSKSSNEKSLDYKKKKIARSLWRINLLIKILNYFGNKPTILIGAASPDKILQFTLKQINEGIRAVCENASIYFFDPNETFTNCSNKKNLIGNSVIKKDVIDMIHLSAEISNYFDLEMSKIIENNRNDCLSLDQLNFNYLTFKDEFKCYSFSPTGLIKLIIKINQFFRKIFV